MLTETRVAAPLKAASVAPSLEANNIETASDIDAQIKALEAQKRKIAIAAIGGDFEAVKAEIAAGYAALVKKAEALKLAYKDDDKNKKYYAPWEIQAKRQDWIIKDFILEQGKPQTVAQIAEGVDYETDAASVQALIDKDQQNSRKLFVAVGDKWWVNGKKVPKA